MKRRGLHHPLTQDFILLKVGAIQKAQCTGEISVNMEHNARLRDSWGPQGLLQPHSEALEHSRNTQSCPLWDTREGHPTRVKTCVPIVKRAASQNMTSGMQNETVPRSGDAHGTVETGSGVATWASEGPQAAEQELMRSLTDLESCLSGINPAGPPTEQTGFRLLTVTQQGGWVQAGRDLTQSCERKEKRVKRKSHVH